MAGEGTLSDAVHRPSYERLLRGEELFMYVTDSLHTKKLTKLQKRPLLRLNHHNNGTLSRYWPSESASMKRMVTQVHGSRCLPA
jgi:hypothetical protein